MPRTGRKLRPVPKKHRDPRFSPYAFAEHGAVMAATVINSLAQQLKKLERKVSTHDEAIIGILKTIRRLMQPPEPCKRSIGFVELQEKRNPETQTPIPRPGVAFIGGGSTYDVFIEHRAALIRLWRQNSFLRKNQPRQPASPG